MPKNLKNLIIGHLHRVKLFASDPELREECVNLISNSLAKKTWLKYGSALSLWNKFSKGKGLKNLQSLAFSCWCSKHAKIKTATVKGYLSALKKMKFLLGFKKDNKNKELEKIILRGMENIESKNSGSSKPVTPVTLEILDSIDQGLKNGICSSCSKQCIWTLSVIAFWSLARLGELLPEKDTFFDKTSTLLWKDVTFKKDKIILRIKSPKTRSPKSKTIYLYKLESNQFCPVAQLENMKKIQIEKGLYKENLPIFLRSSGKSMTKSSFVKSINTALLINKVKNCVLQGKSFRSGIPSVLKNSSFIPKEKALKTLGRWKGDSYRCYVRNPEPENRLIYEKVANSLLKNFFSRKEHPIADPGSGEQRRVGAGVVRFRL